MGALAIAQWKRTLVICLECLIHLSLLSCSNWRVLSIKPWSLNLRTLLVIISSHCLVNFTGHCRPNFHTLHVHWSLLTQTSLDRLGKHECVFLLILIKFSFIAIRITLRSLSVSFVVTGVMFIYDGAKTVVRSLDWTVDKCELSNVIFMDHVQYWSFFNFVDSWVL